jgi:hypothetical protein
VRRDIGLIAALLGGAFALGCEEEPEAHKYPVKIAVQSDPGKALAGAVVQRNGKPIETSDVNGVAALELTGREGDSVDLTVVCPPGFEAPKKSVSVRLSRTGDAQKMPEYAVQCPPAIRHIVVAVRADGGGGMPITYLGRPVTRTDASGSAHVLLRMRPGDQFELGLDTSSFPKHHPQNPKASFLVSTTGDEIQRFDLKFDVERPRPVARAAPPRPVRL